MIMPEHVHLLIAPGEEYEISRILWKIKRPVTYLAIQHVKAACPSFLNRMAHRQRSGKVPHRFWQRGGGFDQNLWTPRRFHAAARTIHRNPVRRKLVERPEDWPWTSYRTWGRGQPDPLPLDLEHVPTLQTH